MNSNGKARCSLPTTDIADQRRPFESLRARMFGSEHGFVMTPLHPIKHSISPSFPRRWEAEFTFEVQHFIPEYFCWSLVVEALSWSVVVRLNKLHEAIVA